MTNTELPSDQHRIIISNGFNKFHLAPAAAGLAKAGALDGLLTGAYPKKALASLLTRLPVKKTAALLQRREALPDALVHPFWAAETLLQASGVARRLGASGLSDRIHRNAHRAYAAAAVTEVRKAAARGATLYHYRAGFGHESVREARRHGMIALCDHSIAHPALVDWLVAHGGCFPDSPRPNPSGFWGDILADIEQADAVLVNSDFVARSFTAQGWAGAPIKVIYLGTDDQFIATIPQRPEQARESNKGPLSLLFAGDFNARKGAETMIAALSDWDGIPWQLAIAGSVPEEIAKAHPGFFADPRVRKLGRLLRPQLAQAMTGAELFLFPSLAEGSARVVFEALACGCYAVTTPNSGSIVEDGVHGALVPPGDAMAIREALTQAWARRDALGEIGRRNAALIRECYLQRHYIDALMALYSELLDQHRPQSGR